MSFDVEREQELAAARLKQKLEADVDRALARINRPTRTERMQELAEAGERFGHAIRSLAELGRALSRVFKELLWR